MKYLRILAVISTIFAGSCTKEHVVGNNRDQQILEAYINLSAHIQNYQLLKTDADGASLDFDMFKKELTGIDQSFEKLVELNYFERRDVLLSPIKDENYELIDKLMNELTLSYGVYVASEMLGNKAKLNFITLKKNEALKLEIYLPKKEAIKFDREFK